MRIYDKALGPNEIASLKSLWNSVTGVEDNSHNNFVVYPNPSSGEINVRGIKQPVLNVLLVDMTGRSVGSSFSMDDSGTIKIRYPRQSSGILILKIETTTEVAYKKIMAY